MKKCVATIFMAVILFSCTKGPENILKQIIPEQGKGPITEKTYDMSFDKIQVSTGINAEVIKSDKEKVVISAPSDIMNKVLVEQDGDEIHIRFDSGVNISSDKVSAKIYTKDFSEIRADSSADIHIKDKFTQDKTIADASSSGQISGDLEANNLEINVSSSGTFSGKIWAVNLKTDASSSGDIKISGKTKNIQAESSSSSEISAKDVISENADLKASSSGSIDISVSNQLSADANSAGDIKVYKKGNVQVVKQESGSGGSISVQ